MKKASRHIWLAGAALVAIAVGVHLVVTIDLWWSVWHHMGQALGDAFTLAGPAVVLVVGMSTLKAYHVSLRKIALTASRKRIHVLLRDFASSSRAALIGWFFASTTFLVYGTVVTRRFDPPMLHFFTSLAWILCACAFGFTASRLFRHFATPLVAAAIWYIVPVALSTSGRRALDLSRLFVDDGIFLGVYKKNETLLLLQAGVAITLGVGLLALVIERRIIFLVAMTFVVSAAYVSLTLPSREISLEYASPVCETTENRTICVAQIHEHLLPEVVGAVDELTAAAEPLIVVDTYIEHDVILDAELFEQESLVVRFFGVKGGQFGLNRITREETTAELARSVFAIDQCNTTMAGEEIAAGSETVAALPKLSPQGEVHVWLANRLEAAGIEIGYRQIPREYRSGELLERLSTASDLQIREWFLDNRTQLSACATDISTHGL